jgi:hypothetical protein
MAMAKVLGLGRFRDDQGGSGDRGGDKEHPSHVGNPEGGN